MERQDILNLWLNNIDGVGNKSVEFLKCLFNSVEEIYDMDESMIEDIRKSLSKGNEKLINNLYQVVNNKNLDKAKRLSERLLNKGITITYPGRQDFPEKLYNIYQVPQLLYVKGKLNKSLDNTKNNIAVIGSRMPDVYGTETSYMFASYLANQGINIISGLAYGIDKTAHKAALESCGYTVGVLGCGIDVVYPRENIELYVKMEEGGAIISEYGLDVKPNPGFFPMRNRLISGLSDGVLVVQAKKRSGSLITCEYALEQGKQIYAIPGKIGDSLSEGCNNLIKNGAMLVSHPKDIMMDMLGPSEYEEQGNHEEIDEKCTSFVEVENNLAPIEKMVYSCLRLEPIYIDEIIKRCNIGVSQGINALFNLEMNGLIKQPVKGYFVKIYYA